MLLTSPGSMPTSREEITGPGVSKGFQAWIQIWSKKFFLAYLLLLEDLLVFLPTLWKSTLRHLGQPRSTSDTTLHWHPKLQWHQVFACGFVRPHLQVSLVFSVVPCASDSQLVTGAFGLPVPFLLSSEGWHSLLIFTGGESITPTRKTPLLRAERSAPRLLGGEVQRMAHFPISCYPCHQGSQGLVLSIYLGSQENSSFSCCPPPLPEWRVGALPSTSNIISLPISCAVYMEQVWLPSADTKQMPHPAYPGKWWGRIWAADFEMAPRNLSPGTCALGSSPAEWRPDSMTCF